MIACAFVPPRGRWFQARFVLGSDHLELGPQGNRLALCYPATHHPKTGTQSSRNERVLTRRNCKSVAMVSVLATSARRASEEEAVNDVFVSGFYFP